MARVGAEGCSFDNGRGGPRLPAAQQGNAVVHPDENRLTRDEEKCVAPDVERRLPAAAKWGE